jgi:hypothetical protein
MKRLLLILLICIAVIPNLSAENDKSSIYLGLDLGYLDPLLSSTLYNQVSVKFDIAPGLEFSFPINYVIPLKDNYDSSSLGCALNLDYHPFENGLFFSFSLFDVTYVFGSDAPSTRLNYLNQMGLGYSFIFKKFLIEPSFIFINPNGVYDVTINQLKNALGGYPTIRFQFIVGYRLF